jgi:hypothetical protein
MPNNYLFTWKADKWPYEKLRTLVDNFDAGLTVTEPWRCAAHRQVRSGDSAYFFKQGDEPRGIFAVGTISGSAIENTTASAGENRWQVPVTFRALVDPTKEILIREAQLLTMPAPPHRWRAQASGIQLESDAARAIDAEIAYLQLQKFLPPEASDVDFNMTDLKDARERINRAIVLRRGQREFREKLLAAYERRCAVTGCNIQDLLEAAHIIPYRGAETNHLQNGLLLRSDIHTLFDCGLITIDHERMTVILASRLEHSSYRKLANRPIRLPKKDSERPSVAALAAHRRATGF